MEYVVEGSRYYLSYQHLREEYMRICKYSDEVFLCKLPEALHLACVICFVKEIPAYVCLSDKGIIHELVHLMHIPDGNTTTVKEIRKLYRETLTIQRDSKTRLMADEVTLHEKYRYGMVELDGLVHDLEAMLTKYKARPDARQAVTSKYQDMVDTTNRLRDRYGLLLIECKIIDSKPKEKKKLYDVVSDI